MGAHCLGGAGDLRTEDGHFMPFLLLSPRTRGTELHSRHPPGIHLRGVKEPAKTITRLLSASSERSQQLGESPVKWKKASVLPMLNKENLQKNRPKFQLSSGPWIPLSNKWRVR